MCYLNPCLCEARLQRKLLPSINIRVLGPMKGPLQRV